MVQFDKHRIAISGIFQLPESMDIPMCLIQKMFRMSEEEVYCQALRDFFIKHGAFYANG